MIKNFDNWEEFEGASEGSGRSEKIWLINNDTKEIGLFKFTKSELTTEHFSEKFAAEIAQVIGVECARVDLGIYHSRIGSFSYRINSDTESLIEGIQLISRHYPAFDPISLYDLAGKEYYSLEMIQKSLEGFDFQNEFNKILVFDYLIGNTDRHQSNWAILQKDKSFKLCPLYDNGSSLCCYVEESKIDDYIGKDIQRFNALVNTKSTSRIRIDKYKKKEPTHLEVLNFLREKKYENVEQMIKQIKYNINECFLNELLQKYDNIISEKKKNLVNKFLLGKIDLL